MRALTVRQPFAELVVTGVKDVENRTWPLPATLYGCPECDGSGCDERATACAGAYVVCDYCGGFPRDVDPFPLRIGIHAGKQYDYDAAHRADLWGVEQGRRQEVLDIVLGAPDHLGVLLGYVTVTGCHHADDCDEALRLTPGNEHVRVACSRWAEPDAYHWVLAEPQRCDPVPMRGRQGLWRLDAEGLPA